MSRFKWDEPVVKGKKKKVVTADFNKANKKTKAPVVTMNWSGTPDIPELRKEIKDWMMKTRKKLWK